MSDRPAKEFRERLLEVDARNQAHRERYEKEVHAMLDKELTGIQKGPYIFSVVLGLSFAILFGTVSVMAPAGFPLLARLGFVAGSIFGLAVIVRSVWILKRGSLNLKTHPTAKVGLAWGITIIMMTLFPLLGVQQPDKPQSVFMVVSGLVFLVLAATFMISNRVDQAELKTREKLLEVEYRLAELTERLPKE